MQEQYNINIPPSKFFFKKISNIDAEAYVSRNRNDCSTSKVYQNMKNKVKKQKTSLKNIQSEYNDITRRTEKKKINKKGYHFAITLLRRIFGYIQDFRLRETCLVRIFLY